MNRAPHKSANQREVDDEAVVTAKFPAELAKGLKVRQRKRV